MLVRGGLVSLSAGEVETDDDDLIAALRGALDVEEVKRGGKKSEKEPAE